MICCPPYQQPFSAVSTLSIEYTQALRDAYGPFPKVAVYMFDRDTGEYVEVNGVPGVSIRFDGTAVKVDLGGPATGYIKIT